METLNATMKQTVSNLEDGQTNYLILDALHSATSSFNRINSIINHSPDQTQD